jgi:hypothetical protein
MPSSATAVKAPPIPIARPPIPVEAIAAWVEAISNNKATLIVKNLFIERGLLNPIFFCSSKIVYK